MVSRVVITDYARNQLDESVLYILLEKKNPQAAKALTTDARLTRKRLLDVADSLRDCDDEDLKALGYKKILFKNHDYLFLYQVIDDTAYVQAMYHQSQDYENLFKTEVL